MPDIAMCAAVDCPVSRSCRRHEDSGTKPSDWQAYVAFKPNNAGGSCASFWPVHPLSETNGSETGA